MCAIRYRIQEQLRTRSTESVKHPTSTEAVGAVQVAGLQEIGQRLEAYEQQLASGHELTQAQLEELRRPRLALVNTDSTEAEEMYGRIARLRDRNFRVRGINLIHRLEDEYEALDREFRLPQTTSKRKAKLADAQREISETLRILRR